MKYNEEALIAFSDELKIPKDTVFEMANQLNNRSFENLKLSQIKAVIRRFKQEGHYNLSISANKPQLICNLYDILMCPTVKATVNVSGSREVIHENVTTHSNKRDFLSTSISGTDVGTLIDTPLKRIVYEELNRQPGLTRHEILSVMAACGGDETLLDVDYLLFKIISQREMNVSKSHSDQISTVESEIKRLEDADLDYAIRESECEREAIQCRKRSRVESLISDSECPVGSADEFKRSILLSTEAADMAPVSCVVVEIGTTTSAVETRKSESSSSSSSGPLTRNPAGDSDSGDSCNRIGSVVLRAMVKLLDQRASPNFDRMAHSSNDCSRCLILIGGSDDAVSGEATILAEVRQVVVQLLQLEHDALKFYPVVCEPYLRGLALYVDSNSLIANSVNNETNSYNSNTAGYTKDNSVILKDVDLGVNCAVSSTLDLLRKQSRKLQRGMYSLTSDGHMVPMLFRRIFRNRCLSARFRASVEKDGFQLLSDSDDDNNKDDGNIRDVIKKNTAVSTSSSAAVSTTTADCNLSRKQQHSIYSESSDDASSNSDDNDEEDEGKKGW